MGWRSRSLWRVHWELSTALKLQRSPLKPPDAFTKAAGLYCCSRWATLFSKGRESDASDHRKQQSCRWVDPTSSRGVLTRSLPHSHFTTESAEMDHCLLDYLLIFFWKLVWKGVQYFPQVNDPADFLCPAILGCFSSSNFFLRAFSLSYFELRYYRVDK